MLGLHHGDGDGAAEAVHAQDFDITDFIQVPALVLPPKTKGKVSLGSFAGKACPGAK